MHGSLSEFTLAQLLQFFALAERSGTVAVRSSGCESRLLVEGDRIIGWGLDDFDARQALLECELLPAPSRRTIEQVSPRRNTPGVSFVVRNLVEPQRWESFARRQLEQDVYPLLNAEEGDFDLQVMRCPPAPLRTSIPVNSVILEGSRWESEIEAAESEGLRGDSVWQRTGSIPQHELRLTNLEWMIWALLAQPASIGEVARRLGFPELATISAIKRLVAFGLLESGAG